MRFSLSRRLDELAASPAARRVYLVAGLSGLAAAAAMVTSMKSGLWVAAGIVAALGGAAMVMWPVTGVLFLLATIIFKYPDFLQGLPLGPNRIVGGVLLLLLLGAILTRRRVDLFKTPTYAGFVIVYVTMVTNVIFVGSVDAPLNLGTLDLTNRTLDRMTTQFAFLTFFGAFVRTRRHLLLAIGLFMLALFITIPGAVTHTYDLTDQGIQGMERARAVATTGIQSAENANRLAFVAALGISIIWFSMLHYRRAVLYAFGALAIPALVLTIFLSGSRSGLLNLGFLMVLLLLQSGVKPGQLAAVALIGFVILGVAYFLVPQPILDRITAFVPSEDARSASESLQLRRVMLAEGIKIVRSSPIVGVGVGNVRWTTAQSPETKGVGLTMHDAYMLALAEGGMIYLGAYLLLFYLTWRSLQSTAKLATRIPEVGLSWLVKATRTNLLLLLTFSLFAEAWNEFPFLLTLSTAVVLTVLYRQALAQPVTQTSRSWALSPSST